MNHHVRRRAALAVLASLALTAVLVPLSAVRSDAAPEDEPGTPVVLSSAGTQPHVSDLLRAPDGTVFASMSSVNSGQGTARVARRLPGGDWELPVVLSYPSVSASPARLALRPDGGVAAVWTEWNGVTGSVVFAERAAGRLWSDRVVLTTDGRDASIAIGADGAVVVTWRRWSTPRVMAADRPAGGEWTTPTLISGVAGADRPQVAVDPSGGALVAYQTVSGVSWIRSARKPAGGVWGDPVDATAPVGLGVDGLDLLMDDDGRATMLWEQDFETADGSDFTGRLATASLAPGASVWSPAEDLSGPEADVQRFSAGLDAAGTVTAAWTEPSAESTVVRTARRASSTWDDPVTVAAPPGSTATPDSVTVDVRADGRAAAAWLGRAGEDVTVEVATSDEDGTWSPSRPVAAYDSLGNAHASLTADGDVDVLYTDSSVKAVFVDRTAPVIDVVVLPTAAASGAVLEFAMGATDRWADLIEVAWDYGDGETGSGAFAHHTYAYGGTYDVTVAATDDSGNTSTRTVPLTVTGPPRPQPTTPGPTPTTGPSPTPGATPTPVVTSARIGSVRLTSPRIRATGSRAKAPRATRLEVQASDAARASVVVAGARRGLPKVTLTRAVTAGHVTLTLRARIGRRTLPPGRYVVTVVAEGAGGASAPARVTLRVIG